MSGGLTEEGFQEEARSEESFELKDSDNLSAL